MADQWHYSKGGEKLGPVSQEELLGKLSSGEVQGNDLVWSDGMTEWAAASSVPELASATASAPPPTDAGGPPPINPAAGGGTEFSAQNIMTIFGIEGLLVAGGALLLLIGCLLPWITADAGPFGSVSGNGFNFWQGTLSFLFGLGAGVCIGLYCFVPGLKGGKQNALIFSIVFTSTGGLSVLFVFIYLVSDKGFGSTGFGAILSLLAAGAITAGGVMSLIAANKQSA